MIMNLSRSIVTKQLSNRFINLSVRSFHQTNINMAKIKKEKGATDIPEPKIELPSLKVYEDDMEKKVGRLMDEFSKLRAGKASADMFNNIFIDAYGSKTSIS